MRDPFESEARNLQTLAEQVSALRSVAKGLPNLWREHQAVDKRLRQVEKNLAYLAERYAEISRKVAANEDR